MVGSNGTLLVQSIYDFLGVRRRAFCLLVCIALFFAALSRYWVSYVPTDSVIKFANPFAALDTGPSAHLSPVFPSFVALLMKVFADGSAGIYAIRLAATLVLSVQLALYPVFSGILGMGGDQRCYRSFHLDYG